MAWKMVDIFSGIGSFSLAASWVWGNDLDILCFCEKDSFCQKVLSKNFPPVPIVGDIYESDSIQKITKGHTVDLLCGGFPCQPTSVAGKRNGTSDDRWLWPPLFETIRMVGPRYCILENVFGLLNLEGGMVFEQCCVDLENEGYEVLTFLLPACACGLQTMERHVWIIAAPNGKRSEGCCVQSLQDIPTVQTHFSGSYQGKTDRWNLPEARVCGVGERVPNRMDRLRALGNSIPPLLVAPPYVGN